jgi:hypothetical protein
MNAIVRFALRSFFVIGLGLASGMVAHAGQGFGHGNGHNGSHDHFFSQNHFLDHDHFDHRFDNGGVFGALYGFDDGYCGSGYGACGNDGYNDHIPYFALHPPVYYSVPVARTYGYSPFAYPPSVMTPPVEEGGPQEITNPYVPKAAPHAEPLTTPPAKSAKPTGARTADAQEPAPSAHEFANDKVLVIVNPYVHPQLAER